MKQPGREDKSEATFVEVAESRLSQGSKARSIRAFKSKERPGLEGPGQDSFDQPQAPSARITYSIRYSRARSFMQPRGGRKLWDLGMGVFLIRSTCLLSPKLSFPRIN